MPNFSPLNQARLLQSYTSMQIISLTDKRAASNLQSAKNPLKAKFLGLAGMHRLESLGSSSW